MKTRYAPARSIKLPKSYIEIVNTIPAQEPKLHTNSAFHKSKPSDVRLNILKKYKNGSTCCIHGTSSHRVTIKYDDYSLLSSPSGIGLCKKCNENNAKKTRMTNADANSHAYE